MDDRTALRVWDAAGARGALRAATVAAALRDQAVDSLLDTPLGDLDREFLQAYRSAVGPRLVLEADCAACGEALDFAVEIDALLAESVGQDAAAVRLPTTRALLAAEAAADAADQLYRWTRGDDVTCTGLLDRAAAADALVAADPLLDAEVTAGCPRCGEDVIAIPDPLGALTSIARALASALLAEVVGLARGTGWAEHDILAMSARRRRLYLELIDA